MTRRIFWRMTQIGVFVLAGTVGTPAQTASPVKFSGLINDHTTASAGSWEVRGEWSLKVNQETGSADFSAALTMERSDYWALTAPTGDPNVRTPHTHHISMVGATVTQDASGFHVNGTAAITANGNPAPFTYSPVEVAITGGTSVAFSNVKLTFQGAAAGHFGSQSLSGIVRPPKVRHSGEANQGSQ